MSPSKQLVFQQDISLTELSIENRRSNRLRKAPLKSAGAPTFNSQPLRKTKPKQKVDNQNDRAQQDTTSLSFNCFRLKHTRSKRKNALHQEDTFVHPNDPAYLATLENMSLPTYHTPLHHVFSQIIDADPLFSHLIQNNPPNESVFPSIHPNELHHLLSLIEDNYSSTNAYHGSLHAADVTQTLYAILQSTLLQPHSNHHPNAPVTLWALLSPLERLVALLAAAAHDIGHPGCSPQYLPILNPSWYADTVHTVSVLEHYHADLLATVIRETGVFSAFSSNTQHKISRLMKRMILVTDVQCTADLLHDCQQLLQHRCPAAEALSSFVQQQSLSSSSCSLLEDNATRFEAILFLLPLLLKCADISNPGKPSPIYFAWIRRVLIELQRYEKIEHHARSTEAQTRDLAVVQLSFIEHISLPVMVATQQVIALSAIDELLDNCQRHCQLWHALSTDSKEKVKTL